MKVHYQLQAAKPKIKEEVQTTPTDAHLTFYDFQCKWKYNE